jgi:hypothetical protein
MRGSVGQQFRDGVRCKIRGRETLPGFGHMRLKLEWTRTCGISDPLYIAGLYVPPIQAMRRPSAVVNTADLPDESKSALRRV